jgi:hypothetical protein
LAINLGRREERRGEGGEIFWFEIKFIFPPIYWFLPSLLTLST